MCRKTNLDIRAYAKEKRVAFWRIAEIYGMADSGFSRLLRHELPEEEKTKIRLIIDELATVEQ